MLAINSADDERNPPETGIMDREIKRVKNGRVFLIPGSELTAGHGTTGQAKFWKQQLADFLQSVPKSGAMFVGWAASAHQARVNRTELVIAS